MTPPESQFSQYISYIQSVMQERLAAGKPNAELFDLTGTALIDRRLP